MINGQSIQSITSEINFACLVRGQGTDSRASTETLNRFMRDTNKSEGGPSVIPAQLASRKVTVPPETPSVNQINMENYNDRVLSFNGTKKMFPHHNPQALAKAGFYYDGNGNGSVRCFYCLLGLTAWDKADIPILEHKEHSAGCKFLKGVEKLSSAEGTTLRAKSYHGVDVNTEFKGLDKNELAEAGWVYDGFNAARCCTGTHRTKGWDEYTDPMVVHVKQQPHCTFVLEVFMGDTYEVGYFTNAIHDRFKKYYDESNPDKKLAIRIQCYSDMRKLGLQLRSKVHQKNDPETVGKVQAQISEDAKLARELSEHFYQLQTGSYL